MERHGAALSRMRHPRREPNVEGPSLEAAGAEFDNRGIKVGDANNRIRLTSYVARLFKTLPA